MPDLRAPVVPAERLAGERPPSLRGDGLVLRPWEAGDAHVLVRAYADPAIQRWHVRSLTGPEEALEWVRSRDQRWRQHTGADWAVLEDGVLVGRAALHGLDLREGRAEAGYWVLPEARGRGIAPRALRTVCAWAFEQLGLMRIELEHSTQNDPSCRAAVKAGFAAEGVKRRAVLHADGWHDMHLHARVATDR